MKQIFKLIIESLLTKIFSAFLCALLSISVRAQNEISTAKTYLNANAAKEKLSVIDIAEMSVSSAYLSPTTGWYHIYFHQNHQSVEVYNGLLSVTMKGGQVNYVANNFVPNLSSNLSFGKFTTKINPIQALQKAAISVNLVPSSVASITQVSSTKLPDGMVNKALYFDPAISNDKIDVKLYWFPTEENDGEKIKSKIVLTWNVKIMTKDGQNIWNVHIDALSGNVVKVIDDVIHCSFGTSEHNKKNHVCIDKKIPNSTTSRTLVANSYGVFDYPLESPNHGTLTSVLNAYTKFVPTGTGPGATNGWHNDGTTNFTNTRGNNVSAKEDLAADNEVTIGASPNSATLDFNFPYTQATGTAAANLNASITNLFYWNNVMHNILWKFGFDEPSGNFQKDNMTRGGAGNDFVFADAQDGSGINNANFSTPPDGSSPRMQMFIFSNAGNPAYQPDSDFDNGVIAHEYGHGWSNRLTGGPAVVTCLQNAEQAGEGWSDYLALMTTTDWATLTPSVASANIPRGIGTYILGQPITGNGIRPFRYSYDKAGINPLVTYAGVANASVFSQPHGIGSIWATMLWDMTWEIILQDNMIVSNIYSVPVNIADYKGNVAALKLVNEGLRLQPCSPSFVQARDAILQADQMLFGGRYRCAISRAFTRRGLGALASTGISANDRVVTEDYTPISGPGLSSPNSATVCSSSPFAYTATTGAAGTFTFAWTRAAVVGISNPAASASSTTINETLINTTVVPITVTYFFTISPDACGGTPAQQPVSVVVNPVLMPTVATYSVCQNATVPAGEGFVVAAAFGNNISSSIVAGATYKRGDGDNVTTYAESTVGTAVYYKTITFVAPVSGATTFEITAANLTGIDTYDTYLTLYQTSFNPAFPATNFLRGDDDSGLLTYSSKLTHNLVAGVTYVFVISTYNNGVTGTFTLTSGTPIFPGGVNNWFTAPTGGTAIFTGDVFNPVGVAGSGIPNTATVGSTPFYVATVASPSCRATTTFNVISTISGAVTVSSTVCSGSNAGTLTLSGYTGSILRWESSIDNFVTIVTIANTTITQAYLNLTQTTKYRAVVQNGSCAAAISTPATITVLSPAVPVATGAIIVLGNSVTLTATSCTGSGFALKWYETVGDMVATMPVSPTADKQYYAKCEQTAGAMVCLSTKSNDVTITVTGPVATVVFVNQANFAAPIQNGLTWATAYSNLQTALGAIPNGTEIWVAKGAYKPTSTISKTISFSIPSGAVVYGGFEGTETLLTQRNFNTNPTILSGEIGTTANPQDNSFHVVLFNAVSNTTRLDGFTIRDGNSNYTVPTSLVFPSSTMLPVTVNDGGGIALDNGSSPMIANCNIINNKGNFGGGIFATNNSNPTFMNCMIMSNESAFGGGAYHLGSNAVYKNVIFSGNKAMGGAVYNNVSSPTFTNVTIAGNGGYNGAIFNSVSLPIVKNSILWGNAPPFDDTQSITTNSIVEGGYLGIGNLNLNPKFVNMTPSGLSPTLAGDNSVINNSPAIDGGENGTITLTNKDLVGNLRRFNGGIVDMGAYEFQGNRVGVLVISIKTGNWEDGTTWDIGRQPLAGDSVIINDNHMVTVNNTGVFKDMQVKTNAKIIYNLIFSKIQLGY